MPVMFDATAWSATLLGMSALFAGIGALRKAGLWRRMIEEVEQSPALQFVCGMLELVVGALAYLANPWVPADPLSCIIKTMGGFMMAEAFAILAFCDIYTQFWLRSLAHMHRGWASLTVLIGLALTLAGLFRFN